MDMDMLPEPASPRHVGGRTTYGGNRAFHNFANDYSHISDPNLRRRLALSEIDKVPFGLYHCRAVAVAGVGFFLDSYDIFAISMVTNLLGLVFWGGATTTTTDGDAGIAAAAVSGIAASYGYESNGGRLPDPVNQALKASTSAGIIIGQLVFGWLADVFGRRRMYGIELAIIVLSTMNCALASPSPSISSTGLLVFWRVVMGVGIGGDYPLSSVITSEFAPTRWRGAMMASVFSMQGIGQLLSAIVALVVTVAFRHEFNGIADASGCGTTCRIAADRCWRIIIGFGALPACFALYYRITIPETPRYTFDVAHDVEKADADIRAYMASKSEGEVDPVVQARLKRVAAPSMSAVPSASWPDVISYFRPWKNLKVLLGTTFSWFFLDLAFYGLALNNSVVLEAIGYSTGPTVYDILYNNAVGTIILACAGSLPGYWTAVVTIDTFGRKPLQVFGFLVLTILFCILGFAYHRLNEAAMLALYVVAQFFFNWGPNTTTFIIPGECFPTRYRSTGHGLSAAMGKIGAILAQVISIPILSKDSPVHCTTTGSRECSPWLNRLMQIFALFMLCGLLISLFCIPETKGITLEELAGEAPTSYNAGRNGSISGGEGGGGIGRRQRMGFLGPYGPWDPFAGGQPAGFFYPKANGGARGGLFHRKRHHGHHADGNDSSSDYNQNGMADDGPRIGIMTSPELAAMDAKTRRKNMQQQHDQQQHKHRATGSRRHLLRNKRDTATTTGANSLTGKTASSGSSSNEETQQQQQQQQETSPHQLHPSSRNGPGSGHGVLSDDYDNDGLRPPPPAATNRAGAGVFPGWGAGWGRIDRGGHATPLEDIRLQDVGSLLK